MDENFIKNYKEIIIGAIIILLLAAFGVKQVIGSSTKIQATTLEHKKQKEKLKEIKKRVAEFEESKKKMQVQQSKIRPVFDPKNGSEDTIASFGGMFEDIIDYVKMNNLKLRSVAYIMSPADDLIYSKFPNLYSVCKVNLFIVGTYMDLEGLLRDLTVYPYFINIAEVQLAPYEKNKQYLLINMTITLYAKKQQAAGSIMS